MKPHDRQGQFEEELREAMRREDAPAGFAERVLVRAREPQTQGPWWRSWFAGANVHALRYAAAVVLIVAVIAGSLEYRRYEREQREGQAAKQQLMLALRIASRKLQYAQAKVNRAGAQQDGPAQTEERE
jgi:hypothetical protein